MASGGRARGGPLDERRLARFLGWTCLARLAVLTPEGAPYVVPLWYHWDAEAIWVVGRQRSAWCRYVQADPRVAVVIDVEGAVEIDGERFLTPKVVVEGTAEIVEEPGGSGWVPIAREMARRYRGEEGVRYIDGTLDQGRWLVRIRPAQLRSWEGGGWATRYEE